VVGRLKNKVSKIQTHHVQNVVFNLKGNMKYFLLLFGLLVIIFSCSTSKKGDKEKKGLDSIQIENNFPSKAKITQDLMKFAKHDYSFQDIVESANMDIQPHYYLLDSFCLTFVPYKRLLAEAHFKQSAVIVYKKGNKAWIADTIYNFYRALLKTQI
jgi:hypothetical protein